MRRDSTTLKNKVKNTTRNKENEKNKGTGKGVEKSTSILLYCRQGGPEKSINLSHF